MVSLESISSIFLCRNIFSFIQHRITRCMGRNGCCLNITESCFMSLKITVEYKDREEIFEDIKWENVKEMRPSLKSDILRSFTPQSAIDYLLADLERKPNDESNLLQQINIYLSKHTTIERFQKGSNALCAVHKLMRKTAVNVVGHYAAAMIVSLHIQELQRRNCEEE